VSTKKEFTHAAVFTHERHITWKIVAAWLRKVDVKNVHAALKDLG
jgi:capsid portal protein